MKQQTEISYLKNRINELAADIATLIQALGQSGVIEFTDKDIIVHKVKLEEENKPDSEQA